MLYMGAVVHAVYMFCFALLSQDDDIRHYREGQHADYAYLIIYTTPRLYGSPGGLIFAASAIARKKSVY